MTAAVDWPGREAILAEAKRRWRRRIPLFVVLPLVVGIVGGIWGGTRHHPTHHNHSATWVKVIVVVLVVLVFLGALALAATLMRKFGFRWREAYRTPITLGLPRPQRREVRRALSHGTPSNDPTLRNVEREVAQRFVRQRRLTMWTFPVLIVVEVGNALLPHRGDGGRVFFLALDVLLLGSWIWSLRITRGAGRLLAAVGEQPA